MQNSNGNGEVRTKVIRCDIYAGGDRIRSFPDDRSLHILQAHRNGNALVLECLDARGDLHICKRAPGATIGTCAKLTSAERVFTLLDSTPEVRDRPGAVERIVAGASRR